MAGNWGIDFAQGAAQQAAGGIFGLTFGALGNKQQFKQQKKLTRLQIDAQNQMTDYNMKKQLEMWDATNFKAQMEQMKKAGLNPGLLYGMGGAGGATTNVATGSAGGGQAANHAGTAASMGATMAQLGLMRAQKENIEADTENKKAQTTKTAGVDTKLGETQIQSLTQGMNESKAKTELMEVETSLKSIEEFIKGKTQNMAIAKYGYELEQAREALEMAERENNIGNATIGDRMKYIIAEATGAVLRNELTRQQTKYTEEQIKKVVEEVKVMISTDKRNWTEVKYESSDRLTKLGQEGDNSLEAMITGIISGLISRATGGQSAPTPIRGLHNRK